MKYQVIKWNKGNGHGKMVAEFDSKEVAENYIKAMTSFEDDKDIEYKIW